MDDDVDLSKDDLIDDELDDAGEDIAEIETKAEKAKSKKGKESEESAQALEFKRVQMTLLIKQGKERGYLTYAEINDSLPDDMVEGDALDNIVSTFSDLGIQVYEQAPDAEVLLMSDNVPVANADDTTEEEVEVAVSTLDSEFGRTTDPVRMYMREMGIVELLTKAQEIEIAKRIEEGQREMMAAISACPAIIQELRDMFAKIRNDEAPVDEVVDGFVGTEEEFHIAGGTTDTIAALRAVRAVSKATLVCKRGPMGASAFTGAIPDSLDDGESGPGFPIEVFNVLGAGDGFMSGLLKGWLDGEPWPVALKYANACGAFAVSRPSGPSIWRSSAVPNV